MDCDNWLNVEEPHVRQRGRRLHRSLPPKGRTHPTKLSNRFPKRRDLQDDRAAMYDPYGCYTCNTCTCCCRCPDPRPQVPVPSMYVIDVKDRTVRRLTYGEAVHALGQKNHDIKMDSYIFRSPWKGLKEDMAAWRPGPPDPLHVCYAKPRFYSDDD